MQIDHKGNEIYINVGVMHAVVFVGGAREAKNAQVVGHNQNLNGLKKRKHRDRNGRPKERQEQIKSQTNLLLRPFGGQKSKLAERKCLKSFCKNVLPAAAGSIILKTCDSKNELKHSNHE